MWWWMGRIIIDKGEFKGWLIKKKKHDDECNGWLLGKERNDNYLIKERNDDE